MFEPILILDAEAFYELRSSKVWCKMNQGFLIVSQIFTFIFPPT